MNDREPRLIVVVTGPAGAGKSTVGALLAEALGCNFADADDFHSAANVAKMRAGVPLDEADRSGWLTELAGWVRRQEQGVLACSALRRSHREALRADQKAVIFVQLTATPAELRTRLESRRGHFMGPALLADQLAIAEPLDAEEPGFAVDAGVPPADVVARILERLGRSPASSLDQFLAVLDYPMFLLTTVHRTTGVRAGCLVGFLTQCSIDPARFLVCLSRANRTHAVALDADVLAVHAPAADQRELAVLFGGNTGDEIDKFARCAWTPGPGGVPLLDACPRRFVGRVREKFVLGDHTGFLLDVQDGPGATTGDLPGRALMFSAVRDLEAGHDA